MAALRVLFQGFAALAAGAFFLLFVLSKETDDWFSWTIQPPLTAAFLGAAYFAAFVLFVWTAGQQNLRAAWATLVPVSVIAVLLLLATVIHEDRFHDDLFGWFWKAAYVLAPVAIAVAVARRSRAPSGSDPRRIGIPPALRSVLAFQGIAMLSTGVWLFVAPDSADALWPWDLTPLTARAIGAFLTGFGASALHAVAANDLSSFRGAALAYASLGALELIAVARFTGDLSGADVDTCLYFAFLLSVLASGLFGWRRAGRLSGAKPPI